MLCNNCQHSAVCKDAEKMKELNIQIKAILLDVEKSFHIDIRCDNFLKPVYITR